MRSDCCSIHTAPGLCTSAHKKNWIIMMKIMMMMMMMNAYVAEAIITMIFWGLNVCYGFILSLSNSLIIMIIIFNQKLSSNVSALDSHSRIPRIRTRASSRYPFLLLLLLIQFWVYTLCILLMYMRVYIYIGKHYPRVQIYSWKIAFGMIQNWRFAIEYWTLMITSAN